MRIFGLIGKKLEHSYSRDHFSRKFSRENIDDAHYLLFPLEALSEFPSLLEEHPDLRGLNVTIP